MTDNDKLEHIKYNWEDADSYNGRFSANHFQTKFLLDKVDQYRRFIEQIALGMYDSPSISHEELRSDAIDILAEELKDED